MELNGIYLVVQQNEGVIDRINAFETHEEAMNCFKKILREDDDCDEVEYDLAVKDECYYNDDYILSIEMTG